MFTIRLAVVWLAIAACTTPIAAHPSPMPGSGFTLKPPAPFFQFQWKEELAEPAVRIGVADLTGDGVPRLILLCQKPLRTELSTLLIKKWNGTEFATEFTGDVSAPPDRMAVGRFAGKKSPAVIVTPDALWAWDGAKYTRKPIGRQVAVFGSARLPSGDEKLIVAKSPRQFDAYSVITGTDAEWLTSKSDAPSGLQVEWESMRAAPVFFAKMGMPGYLGAPGIITLWDVTNAKQPYIIYCHLLTDVSAPSGSPSSSYVTFRDATDFGGEELWKTQKLNGVATDLALEDPKSGGKRGLLILTNNASGGKLRTLYFYQLQ